MTHAVPLRGSRFLLRRWLFFLYAHDHTFMDADQLKPKMPTDGAAIASFILSLSAFALGPLGSIPAIICGHISRSRIRKSDFLAGRGLATAGLVIGYIGLVLFVLGGLYVFMFWRSYFNGTSR